MFVYRTRFCVRHLKVVRILCLAKTDYLAYELTPK